MSTGAFFLTPSRPKFVMAQLAQMVDWGALMVGSSVHKGEGVKVGVLDTGCARNHPDLKDAIFTFNDISGGSNDDGDGHGCVTPDSMVYSSLCGLQNIETLFDAAPGIAHLLPDGSVIKDVSRYSLKTFSLGADGRCVPSNLSHIHKLAYAGELVDVVTRHGVLRLTPWHPVYVVGSRAGSETVKRIRADELRVGHCVAIARQPAGEVGETVYIPLSRRWVCRWCGYEAKGGKRATCRSCNRRNWHEGASDRSIALDERLAYWLGLVVSDGHVAKSDTCVSFTSKDPELLSIFESVSAELFGITSSRPPSHPIETRLHSVDVWRMLVDGLGIPAGNKSRCIALPELVAKSPTPIIAAFVAGLVEGDGSVGEQRRVRIATGSIQFAQKLSMLLKTIGVSASYSENRSEGGFKVKTAKPSYSVRVGRWSALDAQLRFKVSVGAGMRKERKSSEVLSVGRSSYNGPLYDFTVPEHHNYVANGFIVSNTHVSGIIGARDNDAGIIGVAPSCQLGIYKVLSDTGWGEFDWFVKAIYAALEDGCQVINLSLGSNETPPETVHNAIQDARRAGCLIFAASGNDGNGVPATGDAVDFPARWEEVIAVAAVERDRAHSNFSSPGPSVAICAPGRDIYSCWPETGYALDTGTSMACPFVSGAAAVYWSHFLAEGHEHKDIAQLVWAQMQKDAQDLGDPGCDPLYGCGLVRVKVN